MHWALPDPDQVPLLHEVQDIKLVAPLKEDHVPGLQFVQDGELLDDHVPGVHVIHPVDPIPENVPALQMVHNDALALDHVPPLHK